MDKICCHREIPKNETAALHLQLPQKYLKFSCAIDMPGANAVGRSFRWKLFGRLPFKYKQGNYFESLQSKKDLQFCAF